MANPVMHFEIGCKNREETQAFYSGLFGWDMESHEHASMIDTGGDEGINGHISALGHEPHNYTLVYVQVDDLDAYVAKAEALGGASIVPPTEVPGMGHFAWIADNEGTFVGLWKPLES
ncbi:MAG: VOC family protein [Gemmatimonadetes bacterium]|nr:VOC family protein [Gemmatimonadota bacterium]